jgi:hypothetical protein
MTDFPKRHLQDQNPNVGGRRIEGNVEKIADCLTNKSLSNNAVLIEIKKPHTPLYEEIPRWRLRPT